MKNLLILLIFLIPPISYGKNSPLKVTWFGASCIVISDGQTALLFDPFFTRSSLFRILTLRPRMSDPKIINHWLNKVDKKNIKGIFVNHSHFDHTYDLVNSHKITGAKIFGSNSTKNIALGGHISEENIQVASVGDNITVGNFSIKVLSGSHAPHFLGFNLLSGKIDKPIPIDSNIPSYQMGEVFSFLITHPKGSILFHPGSKTNLSSIPKVDFLIQGVALRESTVQLINQIIKPSKAKIIMPVHFDSIFSSLNTLQHLAFVNMGEFYKTIEQNNLNAQIVKPNYGQSFTLDSLQN